MMEALLVVDMGIRIGLALFSEEGRLLWYRSHNLGNRDRLRRAARQVLGELPDLRHLLVEGGGPLADIWLKVAERQGVATHRTDAGQWRRSLLLPRSQRSGSEAKQAAGIVARRIISWSELPRPVALRHDAAEAICAGFWWARKQGWLDVSFDEHIP